MTRHFFKVSDFKIKNLIKKKSNYCSLLSFACDAKYLGVWAKPKFIGGLGLFMGKGDIKGSHPH